MDLTSKAGLRDLEVTLASGLRDDILPFWLRHGLDRERGGMLTALGRKGELLDSDKSVWFQGRSAWTYATAYLDFEARPEYLEASASCVGFLERHCFDSDGRMFFRVTRDGRPVIKRARYVYSETFAVVAMAAYARAADRPEYARKALALFDRVLATLEAPGVLTPKFDPAARAGDGLAIHMILIATAQELRLALPEEAARLDAFIDGEAASITGRFMKPELRAVLEQVDGEGRFDGEHFEGRMLNPGHAMEAAWFLMREAREREARERDAAGKGTGKGKADLGGNNDGKAERLREAGLTMLDWMWDWGWDRDYGGVIYFRDVLGKPGVEYWHDMKFWWPQNEAAIATLMAYADTGEARWAERFGMAWDWAQARFPDAEHGEWYGYLHRDGSPSTDLKGNMYKGPFHIPRMHLQCLGLVRELLER